MDGQTNRPKQICPFNFFKVGGIIMNKCTSYGGGGGGGWGRGVDGRTDEQAQNQYAPSTSSKLGA